MAKRPKYYDQVPVISDAGHDMVAIGGGKRPCTMPFDIFALYMASGGRYVEKVLERRRAAVGKIVALSTRKRRIRVVGEDM